MEQGPKPNYEGLFDDNFKLISVHNMGTQILGAELVIRHGKKDYILNVEIYALHAARSADFEGEDSDADQTYVLPGDEIHFTDLKAIKERKFEDLADFLIEDVSS